MATYLAISAVCEAVVQLLRTAHQTEPVTQIELDFKVYTTQDFSSPMQAGVSLFPYRVLHNGAGRLPVGRMTAGGQIAKPPVPTEVQFLLTAWGKDASLQNTITGWMMRTLEDSPLLTPGLLNAVWDNVFGREETVEVVPGEISTQDLIQLWEKLSDHGYHLSVPYVARVIQIEMPRGRTDL